jgi:uncharacterized protein (TIGR02246 family)
MSEQPEAIEAVEAVEAVERLLAIAEIQALKARYFRGIDTKDWALWGDVFTDDAVLEVPDVGMATTGRDAIVQGVSGVLATARTVHHGHMPEIEVTGPGTARGIWAMYDYVEWPAQGGTRVGLHGFGHYHEEYVRQDGRWRIASSRLERLRVDPLDGTLPPVED